MRRVCGGAVLVIVVLTVIGAGAPAEAGGSTFDFNRRWFAPGQLAVGRTRFSDWVGAQGRVAQGPYFAYLVRGNGWIEPPRLPRKAIRLGQVKMLRVEGTIWKASVRFVVPHVRPGSYHGFDLQRSGPQRVRGRPRRSVDLRRVFSGAGEDESG